MRGSYWRIGAAALAASALQTFAAPAGSPVDIHGFLHEADLKANNRLTLVDQNNKPVQLTGMSLFWSGWAGQFYNRKTVGWLASNWKISVIRAAIGVDGTGNYLDVANHGAEANTARADSVIQAAIDYGIYVIIDWHDHFAFKHTAKSVEFFQRMATKWGKYPNIIYEIYNEPLGEQAATTSNPNGIPAIDWSTQIKPYSETVLAAIRAIDSTNLILVGTPSWDQDLDAVVADPIDNTVFTNIAYTLHFYSGSHMAALRTVGTNALSAGLPLFISEWGTTNADGGSLTGTSKGALYLPEADRWLAWAKTNNLSWCNWSVTNKAEGSAALKPIAGSQGWWPDSVISASGSYVRDKLKALNASYVYPDPPPGDKPDTANIPGRVQAEGFVNMSGVQTESGADNDGTGDLGYIENGDWADYVVNVTSPGPFYFHARVAGAGTGGTLVLKNETGTTLASVPVTTTGGWQKWTTLTDSSHQITLPVGLAHLRLVFQGTGTKSLFNLNWVAFNSELDGVIQPSRRPHLAWSLSGNVLTLNNLDKNWTHLSVRDVRGQLVAQSDLQGGSAKLSLAAKGILFAEFSGNQDREVHKLLVSN